MAEASLQIAVVGHTNAGKTSLMRTLTHDRGFGTVSDRPATTRDVQGAALLADGQPVVALYDTPGLEDALGLADHLDTRHPDARDPTARIEAFVAGDHDGGRYEQEAKVLRAMLRCDAALVVIDAREPVLAKHREELALLAACGRPLLPVLNFVVDPQAAPDVWKAQIARVGLHVIASFDSVVYDDAAERALFEKLGVLLEKQRPRLERLVAQRRSDRDAQTAAACRLVADLLIRVAGLEVTQPAGVAEGVGYERLRAAVVDAEQASVGALLGLYRFDLEAYVPPPLPLQDGQWQQDPFDPDALRAFGIQAGSAAAAGGAAGFAIDLMTGGLSLGAGTALGAGAGLAWHAGGRYGRRWIERLQGMRRLRVDETTLALLSARACALLAALQRRGHAATTPVAAPAGAARGWPSAPLRRRVLEASRSQAVDAAALASEVRRCLEGSV